MPRWLQRLRRQQAARRQEAITERLETIDIRGDTFSPLPTPVPVAQLQVHEPSTITDPRRLYDYEAQFRRERDGVFEPQTKPPAEDA